jgi:hypothetical protein
MVLVEIREIEDDLVAMRKKKSLLNNDMGRNTYIWNEPTLQNTKKSSTDKESSFTTKAILTHGHCRPKDHLSGDPSVGTSPLADQLRRQLCTEECKFEDSISKVVV